MEIVSSTNSQFTARSEAVKQDLNARPINTKPEQNTKAELDRGVTFSAVSAAEKAQKEKEQEQESETLVNVAKELTDMVSLMQKGLKFTVDEQSGQQVIKVQDVSSGDIIRQIPSEEALKLAEKLSEVSGILMKIEV